MERLLKKSGQYICTKKRRFAGFNAQAIEARPLQASVVGEPTASPSLHWSLPEEPPSINPDETWWLFTREAVFYPIW